jgi:hypothetical protein
VPQVVKPQPVQPRLCAQLVPPAVDIASLGRTTVRTEVSVFGFTNCKAPPVRCNARCTCSLPRFQVNVVPAQPEQFAAEPAWADLGACARQPVHRPRTGRRILDAGCGSGPLFAALRDRGAIVTGIDKSAGMLDVARRRLGEDADLRVAELGRPLPSPTTRSTTSRRPWSCTTWRTGGRPSPSCGACSSPAVASSCQLTIPL